MLDLKAQSLVSTIMVRTTGSICPPFLPNPWKIQAEVTEEICTKQKKKVDCLPLSYMVMSVDLQMILGSTLNSVGNDPFHITCSVLKLYTIHSTMQSFFLFLKKKNKK